MVNPLFSLNELIMMLKEMVELESPSGNKHHLDRLARHIGSMFVSPGFLVEYSIQDKAGDHLIVRSMRAKDKKPVLLLCHMDTVWDAGTLAQRPLRFEGDRLYGPGVLDMKGGIVIGISTLLSLQRVGELGSHPVILLITSDEEVGSRTSRALIERLAAEAELVLCLEPGLADGALKTSRKGVGQIEIVVEGRAAHAGGSHEKGRNAIEELAHHVLAAQKMTDYSCGTTLNVGLISGGSRSNVVPELASALIDFRMTDAGEAERVLQWAKSLRPVLEGTALQVNAALERPPMARDACMAATFERIRQIGEKIGFDLREGSTGGGSDANFVARLGIPVMDGLGAVGDGAHAVDEFIVLASLSERAVLLRQILLDW
jgi:glutamate carboxypeptidase